MKNLQKMYEQMLENEKRHRRYVAFILALSMIVGFAVPYELIVPGISMTAEEQIADNPEYEYILDSESEEFEGSVDAFLEEENSRPSLSLRTPEDVYLLAEDQGDPWFHDIQETVPTGAAVEIKDAHVTELSIVGNDDGGAAPSVSVNFNMKYQFINQQDRTDIIANGGYVYFQINTNEANDGVKLTQGYSGEDFFSDDDVYKTTKGKHCGYYSISKSGLVVLKFTQEYLDYLII